jgi:hypothetical protein
MATLNITKTWVTGEVLTADDLNNAFGQIEDLINTTGLDPANLNKSLALNSMSWHFDGIGGGTSHDIRVRVPSGFTYEYVELSVYSVTFSGGSPVVEVDFNNGSTALLSGALTLSAAGGNEVTTFLQDSATNGDVLQITVENTGSGNANDVTVVLTVKAELTD